MDFRPSHILPLIPCILVSALAPAQKSKVVAAYNYEQAYLSSKDCRELAKAKEAIEMGITDEVASEWAKSWYYRGNVFYNIYISEDPACRSLSEPALDQAYESYQKSLSLDEKKRYIKDIEPRISVIANLYMQRGANRFNVKEYELALNDFEKSVEVARYFGKTDTTALYNAALTSEKLRKYDRAALYYEGLVDIGYRDVRVYHFLSQALLETGDTAKSFQVIKSGRKIFPTNQDLIIDELNHFLKHKQTQLALENLNNALKVMPENAELHFVKGILMDGSGQWEMARDCYKRAIEYNPDHFKAHYNLGALYFNKGVEYVDYAGQLGENKKKEFAEASEQSKMFFDLALPHLEKANTLDPQDRDTMVSLKNLYSRTGNDEGYKRVSHILDN